MCKNSVSQISLSFFCYDNIVTEILILQHSVLFNTPLNSNQLQIKTLAIAPLITNMEVNGDSKIKTIPKKIQYHELLLHRFTTSNQNISSNTVFKKKYNQSERIRLCTNQKVKESQKIRTISVYFPTYFSLLHTTLCYSDINKTKKSESY